VILFSLQLLSETFQHFSFQEEWSEIDRECILIVMYSNRYYSPI